MRGLKVSRKKTVGAVTSWFCAAAPAWPDLMFHQRWAASTNVLSSAVPLTQVKTL